MPAANPFETPRLKGIRLLQGTLRVVTAIQCFGLAAAWLHQGRSSAVAVWIARNWEAAPEQLTRIENGAAGLLIAAGLLTLLRPATLILIPVILYQILLAAAATVVQDSPVRLLEPACHAVRIVVPLALMLLDFWPPRIRATLPMTLVAVTLLRVATAISFTGLGLSAIYESQHGGGSRRLLEAVVQNAFHLEMTANAANWWLAVIGAGEIALAVALLCSRSPLIAALTTGWGLLLAHSWTLAHGLEGYDVTLAQIAYAGAPFTVLVFWLTSLREQRPVFVPESLSASQDSLA